MKVVFIGLSNKPNLEPLSRESISGALIGDIIDRLGLECVKTNLVDFAPLDKNGKLRYPTRNEKDLGFKNLIKVLEKNDPCLGVCLGSEVFEYLNGKIVNTVKIKHPAYIAVYRRKFKEDYINDACNLIKDYINKKSNIKC